MTRIERAERYNRKLQMLGNAGLEFECCDEDGSVCLTDIYRGSKCSITIPEFVTKIHGRTASSLIDRFGCSVELDTDLSGMHVFNKLFADKSIGSRIKFNRTIHSMTSGDELFECRDLSTIENIENLDTSNCVHFSYAYYCARSSEEVKVDIRSAKVLSRMFCGAKCKKVTFTGRMKSPAGSARLAFEDIEAEYVDLGSLELRSSRCTELMFNVARIGVLDMRGLRIAEIVSYRSLMFKLASIGRIIYPEDKSTAEYIKEETEAAGVKL